MGNARARRVIPIAVLLLAMILTPLLSGFGRTSAQVVPLGDTSGAAFAEEIAQGVAEVSASDVAWRVVQQETQPSEDAPLFDQSLGFVIAPEGPVLVNDLTTGNQVQLSEGAATFVAGGTQQQIATVDDDVPYYLVSLVPEENVTDEGDGQLIFAGDSFSAPAGRRAFSLQLATLGTDASVEIDVIEGEALVLVTAGMVEVNDGDLAAGDAATFDEPIELLNTGDDEARVYIATVGEEVEPLPTFTGSVTLQVQTCPEGATRENFDPASCTPVNANSGFAVGLLDANQQQVATNDDLSDGQVTWSDLPFGTYLYARPTLPTPYGSTLWTDANSVPLQTAEATISAANPDVFHILYVFVIPSGSITIDVRSCPEGMTPENLDAEQCEPADPASGYAVEVTTPDGTVLTLADAFAEGSIYYFTDLDIQRGSATEGADSGLYTIEEVTLPEGATDYVIVSGSAGEVNSPVTYVLDASTPDIYVTIYNFGPEEPEEPEGSMVFRVLACPDGVTRNDTDEFDTCTMIQSGFGAVLITPDGEQLTLADAAIGGDGFVWPNLEAGTYSFGLSSLPAGYVDALAPGYASSPDDPSRIDVTISEDNPNPVINVYIFTDR